MQGQPREIFSKHRKSPHILYDHPVKPRFIKGSDKVREPVQLLLSHERIDGQIDLFSVKMRLIQRGKHLAAAEISGVRPRPVPLSAYVYRIRAGLQRRLKAAVIPGGCKKLRSLHSQSPFPSK